MKVAGLTASGSKTTIEITDSIFAPEVNQQLLAQAVRAYLFNQRQGTASTKTRAEVDRTKKKWFKQKGTGNARHGARTPNIFVGGGVSHGPRGHKSWRLTLTKVSRRQALQSALTAQAENIIVSDQLVDLDGKTKIAAQIIKHIASSTEKILVVVDQPTEKMLRSLRNVEQVLITRASRINALEVAMADKIVFTKQAVAALAARVAGEEAAAVAPKKDTSESAK